MRCSLINALGVALIVLSAGCKEHTTEGSSFTETGLEYKIVYIGDEKYSFKSGDRVKVRWELIGSDREKNIKGAVAVDYSPEKDTGLMEALGLLYMGDSALFAVNEKLLKQAGLYGADADLMALNPFDVADKMELKFEKKFEGITAFTAKKGDELFYEVLDTLMHYPYNEIGGIHYFQIRKGRGKSIQSGAEVALDYQGFLLNGKKFDSTRDRGDSFEFFYGDPDQLLKGLETVLRGKREGECGVAVIPSRFAFGAGSADGTVPPNAAVVYEFEVKKVKIHDNKKKI